MRRTCLALALVTVPLLACPGDDQGETAASSGNPVTGVSTSVPSTSSDDGSSSSSSDSSMGSGGATSGSGSSGPPADGDGSTTAAGTSPLDACLANCDHLIECGLEDVPNCGIPCSGVPAMVAGCSEEYVAQQECAAALSCEDLQLWVDAMVQPGDHPCMAEDDAYQECEVATSG